MFTNVGSLSVCRTTQGMRRRPAITRPFAPPSVHAPRSPGLQPVDVSIAIVVLATNAPRPSGRLPLHVPAVVQAFRPSMFSIAVVAWQEIAGPPGRLPLHVPL